MDMCLGTVQFGTKYGIVGNTKPAFVECEEIMDYACAHGITTFDTASAYGDAQEFLGNYFERSKWKFNSRVVSKSIGENAEEIEKDLNNILAKLKMDDIFGYLLHSAKDIYDVNKVNVLKEAKVKGVVKKIGASVYKPNEAVFAAKQEWIDIIQIPYNVLDQRLNSTEFFHIARENNKIIYARSTLLQGLLSMSEQECFKKLPFASPYIRKYAEIVNKYNGSQVETAINFVKENRFINSLLFGVDSVAQLAELIRTFDNGKIDINMLEELEGAFRNVENERVLMPNLW